MLLLVQVFWKSYRFADCVDKVNVWIFKIYQNIQTVKFLLLIIYNDAMLK